MQELFDSFKRIKGLERVDNLTARQQRLIGLNALSLRVLTGKTEEARKELATLRKNMKETKEKNQETGSSAEIEIATEEDLILVEAGILFRQKKFQECTSLLETASQQHHDLPRLSVARSHVALRSTNDVVKAAKILHDDLSLRSTPAGIATQVRLYERAESLKEKEQAASVLEEALRDAPSGTKFRATLLSASAEMAMKSGDYHGAATTYQQILDETEQLKEDDSTSLIVAARANLVMACSFFDPERAAREAMALPTPEFVMSKPEDLEESLAPQNTFNNKRSERKDSVIEEGGETKMDEETRKKKEEKERETQQSLLVARKKRIMKRRAKRRVQYLENLRLLPENHEKTEWPPAVDPERWVPKRLRHAKRRNRGRAGRAKQMQGGHQGGVVSQSDLEKFDAAAKAQRERDEEGGESKSNSKKGKKGKKKKGKKGRR